MELLRSLGSPLVGFYRAIFTGEFGILPPVAFVLQLALQFYFVGNPGLTFGGTFLWGLVLANIHLVCSFLILTMMLGAAFTSNKPLTQDAVGFFIVALVVSFVLTALLGLVFGFGAGFLGGLFIAFISALFGSVFDTVAVVGLIKRQMRS
jgi:hypothetical protein